MRIHVLTLDEVGATLELVADAHDWHSAEPVLQLVRHGRVIANYLPQDVLVSRRAYGLRAAAVVAAWAAATVRTHVELVAADKYLRRWPEGPQVGGPVLHAAFAR